MSGSIVNTISRFEGISLPEMDDVALQKRTDTKFVIPINKLPIVLEAIHKQYRILEIEGLRLMNYKSLYFDTPENKFYTDHHNGKIKRTKVRMRQYVDSDLYFLEIKMKDGRSNTNKSRLSIDGFEDISSPLFQDFLQDTTNIDYDLKPVLWNNFQRFTLANKQEKERITIDINLEFKFEDKDKSFSDLAVIEVKQPKFNNNSAIVQALKKNGIHAFGFSKYCLGMTHLYEDLKYNAFKPKILRINKITV